MFESRKNEENIMVIVCLNKEFQLKKYFSKFKSNTFMKIREYDFIIGTKFLKSSQFPSKKEI